MGRKSFVVGVGMTKFEKPFSKEWTYLDMVKEAGTLALRDAGIAFEEVEQACAGYVYGDSTAGQRAIYGLGLTGIPIYNLNNNCATGSTALLLAKRLVEGGAANCVLAVGWEKMQRGSLGTDANLEDATLPLYRHVHRIFELRGREQAPLAPQMFGGAGREHMEKHGTTAEQFAKVAVKNHRHSVHNPYSQFQTEFTLEQVCAAPIVYPPLTRLQCCPTSDGAAAAVIASEAFIREHTLESQAVEILGMAMSTDLPTSFGEHSAIKVVGFDMTRNAARQVFEQSGFGPEDVDVIELHDCFSTNELLTYEALGLCAEGKGGELIDSGAVTYGGRWVINPSGGLISKGHPLGATGIAQCSELVWQLRGKAERRQVEGAKLALQHNLGLGGAAVVAMYRKAEVAA